MKCPDCGLWFREEAEPRLRCLTHQMGATREHCHVGQTIIGEDGRETEATHDPWCVVVDVYPEYAQ